MITKKVKINKYAPYASSYEADYAKRLQLLKLAGEIKDWSHEPTKFQIAWDCRYKPDFRVVTNDNVIEYHEVKGWMRDDANVKLKVSATLFPHYRFVLVTKKDGNWVHKQVKTVKPNEAPNRKGEN